jgi:hypothetical protein
VRRVGGRRAGARRHVHDVLVLGHLLLGHRDVLDRRRERLLELGDRIGGEQHRGDQRRDA